MLVKRETFGMLSPLHSRRSRHDEVLISFTNEEGSYEEVAHFFGEQAFRNSEAFLIAHNTLNNKENA